MLSRVGISLFWSDLPSCHRCSSEQMWDNCREFRERKKPEEVWTHLPKAICGTFCAAAFIVNFCLVRPCPNSLMIQFMANASRPITFLWKGWSSLLYPHTAPKLILRDGPSAHLLLASCHLHPAIPHPAPAPKEQQAQGLLNRSLSQQNLQQRIRTHNLTCPDNSKCKSQQKKQHQDRQTRSIHQPLNHYLGWTVRDRSSVLCVLALQWKSAMGHPPELEL